MKLNKTQTWIVNASRLIEADSKGAVNILHAIRGARVEWMLRDKQGRLVCDWTTTAQALSFAEGYLAALKVAKDKAGAL